LGADRSMSYMAKMGGWSILDYGLRFAGKPYDWLQLGYASYLSSWALMNTGTPESDYGFWAHGKENDGATGWAFMSAKSGMAWIRHEIPRGAWHYDGEADLGYGAAVRMASTLLVDDPLFGWITYGGSITGRYPVLSVIPRDGLRSRFWIVCDEERFGLELERDGFSKGSEITYSPERGIVTAFIENRAEDNHRTRLIINSQSKWTLLLDGKKFELEESGGKVYADIKISKKEHKIVLERKQ